LNAGMSKDGGGAGGSMVNGKMNGLYRVAVCKVLDSKRRVLCVVWSSRDKVGG
jgi:hypothetical protein